MRSTDRSKRTPAVARRFSSVLLVMGLLRFSTFTTDKVFKIGNITHLFVKFGNESQNRKMSQLCMETII